MVDDFPIQCKWPCSSSASCPNASETSSSIFTVGSSDSPLPLVLRLSPPFVSTELSRTRGRIDCSTFETALSGNGGAEDVDWDWLPDRAADIAVRSSPVVWVTCSRMGVTC